MTEPPRTGPGRVCSNDHVVIGENLRMAGRRAVCVTCSAAWSLASLHRLRRECLAELGGKCECCGETEDAFLCVDHRNGGGNLLRRKRNPRGLNASSGYQVYREAKREGYPRDVYRLLCWNCNYGVTRPGGCPHQRGQTND